MNRPDNPRFPHNCVIWRQTAVSPLDDEYTGYDPLADDEAADDNQDVSGETSDIPDNPDVSSVIYEGSCRAYDKNTTSDRGEVITSYRGLALPLTREDWQALGVVPMEGDFIKVDRGGYVEYGHVVDKNPSNFGGTHVLWRFVRN